MECGGGGVSGLGVNVWGDRRNRGELGGKENRIGWHVPVF